MRVLSCVILLVLLLVPTWSGETRLALLGDRARVRAARVPLFAKAPAADRLGALTYLGGVALTSPDPAFGGFSALDVAGGRVTLLSDGGNVVRFRLDADWKPRDAAFANLTAGPGTGWTKMDRDTESLVRDPAGGWWVGYERANAIWHYDAGFRRATAHRKPPQMQAWPSNGGPEAMVRLGDGRFMILSEGERPKGPDGKRLRGERMGLVFLSDPMRDDRDGYRFRFVPPSGYEPDDMAVLPDGRLLVLTRKAAFPAGFTAKLVLVDAAAIAPGARVTGRVLATFAAPALHDNFEGLSVTSEGRDTILWIVSDDNQSLLQRTLLLKFRLDL